MEALVELINEGRFSNLVKIPTPTLEDVLDYASAAVALSLTLDSFVIHCLNITFDDDVDGDADYGFLSKPSLVNKHLNLQHNKVVKNLKSFANLGKLDIHEVNGYVRDISRYDYIVDQCPLTLQKLCYTGEIIIDDGDSDEEETRRRLSPPPILVKSSNNDIKELEVTASCHIKEEESIKYIMQKFQGLEQLIVNVWQDWYNNFTKEIDYFQYISHISKFAVRYYLTRDINSGMELITNFINIAFPDDAPTAPTFLLHARLDFVKRVRRDANSLIPDGEEIHRLCSSYIAVSSHDCVKNANNDEKWWSIAQYGKENATVIDLDMKLTRDDDKEINKGRETFLGDFMKDYGSRLQHLCFSA